MSQEKIQKEYNALKEELQEQLSKKQPDMKEITDRLIAEALATQAKKFDAERI